MELLRFGSARRVSHTLATLALTGWLAGGCGLPDGDRSPGPDELVEYEEELNLARFNLGVSVEPALARFTSADEVIARVSFRNGGTRHLRLSLWTLPESAEEAELFTVSHNGVELPFRGRHYKYPAANTRYLLSLAPGDTVTRQMNLGQIFEFGQTGEYQVAYQVRSFEVLVDGRRRVGRLRSPERTFQVEGRPFLRPFPFDPNAPPPAGASLAFERCTAAQQDAVSSALAEGTSMAQAAASYLSVGPRDAARFTTWFGPPAAARWDLTALHFQRLASAFNSQRLLVDCGCTGGYYAYVYADLPYRIFLCRAFWSAPLTGTDSKAGTLVHELSHFAAVADAEDFAYGQSAARRLAVQSPGRAARNADSHEYFAENHPPLP